MVKRGWAAGLENTAEYFVRVMSIIRPRENTPVRAAARSKFHWRLSALRPFQPSRWPRIGKAAGTRGQITGKKTGTWYCQYCNRAGRQMGSAFRDRH